MISLITEPCFFPTDGNFEDLRGEYIPLFSKRYTDKLPGFNAINFKQDSVCINKKNVFRGFHGDSHTVKVITPAKGQFVLFYFDYSLYKNTSSVDVQYHLVSSEDKLSLVLPPNFANAYLSLTEDSIYYYKQSTEYGDYPQFTVKYNDPKLNLTLPIPSSQLILSKRDI